MKKITVFALAILTAFTSFSQIKMAGKEVIERFLKSKTYIVLEENPFSPFNMWVEEGLDGNWKLTAYEVIDMATFEKKNRDASASFLFVSMASLGNSGNYAYTILNLSMGDASGNINNMKDVCIVPVSYEEADYEHFDFKFPALIRFMHYYADYAKNKQTGDIMDMVKENASQTSQYEVWFVKDELAAEVNTVEKIRQYYEGSVKIVSREELAAAIQEGRKDVAFLHKVGPEETEGSGFSCYKFILTAAEGKPLFFSSHKVSSKSPDAFLADDFKNLGK